MNLDKIKLEEFNDCPGTQYIQNYIDDKGLLFMNVEDADRDYWKNEGDTLVVSISNDLKGVAAAHIGKLAVDMNADEFNFYSSNGKTYFRLWWD